MNAKRLGILVGIGSFGLLIEGVRGITLDLGDGIALALGFALFCFMSYIVGRLDGARNSERSE